MERLKLIREVIAANVVETQHELVVLMKENGCDVTQATLSRDFRELALVKIYKDGKKIYALADQEKQNEAFQTIFRQFVLSVQSTMFMLVVHTRLGEADLLANEFDISKREEVLGTVAGADTLLVVCADIVSADRLKKEIEDALN
jgi:transcriptional regulator of arginine metabolism